MQKWEALTLLSTLSTSTAQKSSRAGLSDLDVSHVSTHGEATIEGSRLVSWYVGLRTLPLLTWLCESRESIGIYDPEKP